MQSSVKNSPETEEFAENMAKIADHCQHIMQKFLEKHKSAEPSAMGVPLGIGEAFAEMMGKMLADPNKFWQSQMDFYQEYLMLLGNASLKFLGEDVEPLYKPEEKDRRFKDEVWRENALFDFIKQSYLLTSSWMQRQVHDVEGLDKKTMQKIDFFTRQYVDALAPSNFVLTNPEVLKKTIETKGENLVRGLENLLDDLEKSKGVLNVKMTDAASFEVGKNLAITGGKVIFKNELLELIQYSPATKEVHERPLLIISPWINKYYVLDMQPQNSFVKWLVEQGYTVFITSWVNPGPELKDVSFEDYIKKGALAAMEAVEKATGEKSINVMAYCIGGTLMAATLAFLEAQKKADRIKSVTYLTTLVDFGNPGELGVFIDEEQLESMEEKMREVGFLDAGEMSIAFNMLRANDLIWSFVINNYLLGQAPFPFDLLYWNADSTRLPAAMHSYYLRNMYLLNNLVKPGKLKMCGEKIDLTKIKTPTYILSTMEDHIAPWASTYAATQLYKGKVKFVLSGSGHIAGVVNPPSKNKYAYWTNDKNPENPVEWFNSASQHAGSWWLDWDEWMAENKYNGGKVPARKPGEGKLKALAPAPGSYVKLRS